MKIKELRVGLGLSQSEFAKKFHLNKGTLANWEQGFRNPPDYVEYMIETIIKQEKMIDNQTPKEHFIKERNKQTMNKPVYNVILNSNGKFIPYNIFQNFYVDNFLTKYKKKPTKDRNKEEFAKEFEKICIYSFWSKSEYEIIIKQWVGKECEEKVDVFWQLKHNWNIVVDIAWEVVKPKRKGVAK